MNILLVEPYFGGSHAAWVEGFQAHSSQRADRLTLPGRHWKWRMHGGAVTLARAFRNLSQLPDLLLATDMLDLTSFLALTRPDTARIPVIAYFHENQLAYPWSPQDRDARRGWDQHYSFINFTTALAADAVWFNSAYNQDSFLNGLQEMLSSLRDYRELSQLDQLAKTAEVMPVGLDLKALDCHRPIQERNGAPLILWNHRWEHDKDPQAFFQALFALAERGFAFEVAVLGAHSPRYPPIFDEARQYLSDRIVHFSYAVDFEAYARWLWAADILPVTSRHDFFGIGVAEAIYCQTFPLLPKRLAYPELLPEPHHGPCFYEEGEALTERLAILIQEGPPIAPAELAKSIARFDWSLMAPLYERRMAELMDGA